MLYLLPSVLNWWHIYEAKLPRLGTKTNKNIIHGSGGGEKLDKNRVIHNVRIKETRQTCRPEVKPENASS